MNEIKQNTPEWLSLRKKFIGASDAPIIVGVSPWTNNIELWQQKIGLSGEKDLSIAMEKGNLVEPMALQQFEFETGIAMKPRVVFHSDIDYLMASLDGLSDDLTSALEIKAAGEVDHQTAIEGNIPEKYMPQLQHQLEVTGLSSINYYSVFAEWSATLNSYVIKDTRHIVVDRDSVYIKEILEQEQIFRDCVVNYKIPELVKKHFLPIKNKRWNELAVKMFEFDDEIARLEAMKKTHREELLMISQGQQCIGGGVMLQKVVSKGSIQYKEIPELANVDIEKFRKSDVVSWRFNKVK